MQKYKQSITIFGFVIPILLVLVFTVICLVIAGKVKDTATKRETAYMQHNTLQNQVTTLQAGILKKQEANEEWNEVLSSDIRPALQSNLKDILGKYTSRQLAQTGFFRPSTMGRLAMGAQQPSSTVNLRFRGTYLPMEKALLELESKLPQMQVNTLNIKRERTSDELNFDLSYTIWEKEDDK